MDNKQFVKNISMAILELEAEDIMLFKKEDFLTSMIVRSESNNGRYFIDKLCDYMPLKDEENLMGTLHKKIESIHEKRTDLIAQIEVLEELKEEGLERIESEELHRIEAEKFGKFFENLFE